MSTRPALGKTVWTDADFGELSWHDNEVHAIALEPALPEPGRLRFTIGLRASGFTQYLRRAPVHSPC